jgi:hypothetical protein
MAVLPARSLSRGDSPHYFHCSHNTYQELAELLGVHAVPAYVMNLQSLITGKQTPEELQRLCCL